MDFSLKEANTKIEFDKRDFTRYSSAIWRIKSPKREKKHIIHGATFPKTLISQLIRLYAPEPYQNVCDPFLGTGTTLEACVDTFRHCFGFELNPQFYAYCKQIKDQQQKAMTYLLTQHSKSPQIKVWNTDCRNILKYIQPNSMRLMITSPPYANFIYRSIKDREKRQDNYKHSTIKPYSSVDNEKDFGNLIYSHEISNKLQIHPKTTYLDEIEALMQKCYTITEPNGYNIWIIKDYRYTEVGIPYIDFHGDFARLGQKVGFLYHDLRIWDQSEQRNLKFRGSKNIYYTNQNCTFIVILRKIVQ